MLRTPIVTLFLLANSFLSAAYADIFQTINTYPTGDSPIAAVIADFNNDGRADLATVNFRDDNVSVLLGTGGGKFSGPKNLPKGTGTVDIASGDLNEDGKADLVVSDGNKYIRVSIGKGNGGFAKPTVIKLGGEPMGIAIADLNGDGHLDLAVALGGPSTFGNGGVAILLGQGDGTFEPASVYAVKGSATHVAVADLDGDGIPDLAVAIENDPDFKSALATLKGNGDGTFQPAKSMLPGGYGNDVAAGDFNHDGAIDLAVADRLYGVVHVLLSHGHGQFQEAVDYPARSFPSRVQSIDLNGDGNPDLVLGGTHVSILLGQADGTFGPAVNWAIGDYFAVAGLLDGDQYPDIVAGEFSEVGVAVGNGDGTFHAGHPYLVGDHLFDRLDGFDSADFNGDGQPDIVLGRNTGSSSQLQFFAGTADGGFVPGASFGDFTPKFVKAGDFNGDGKMDVAAVEYSGYGLFIFLGNGDGTFQSAQFTSAPDGELGLAVGDFNHDGLTDVALTGAISNRLFVFLSKGNGRFQPAIQYTTDKFPQQPLIQDFDNDGNLDILEANYSGNTFGAFLGNGDGTFAPPIVTAAPYAGSSAAGDFNGDGKLDVVIGSLGTEVFLGNGDGTFQSPQTLTTGYGPVAVADINGDQQADIVVSGVGSDMLAFLGNGDATFRPELPVPSGSPGSSYLLLIDLTGDPLPEIIVSDGMDSFAVLKNVSNASNSFSIYR